MKGKKMHPTALALNQLEGELNSAFYERKAAIHAAILGLVSGRHVMFLGAPGVAKTNVSRHMLHAIVNCNKFEVQLTKRTPNEKVQGPVNLKRLREEGVYLHQRTGYVTWAQLAILDEIGKASAVTGHELLTLLADKKYHEVVDGVSIHDAPLHAAFCPSNEIPTHESDEAAALYDRLLIRVLVEDVKDKKNFLAMLTGDVPLPTVQIEFDDIKKVTEVELPQIELSAAAGEGIVKLREQLAARGVAPSARRWRWSMDVLRAEAFLTGSKTIEEEHLGVLQYTLWDEYDQIEVAQTLALSASNPFYEAMQVQIAMIGEVEKGMNDRAGDQSALRVYGNEATQKLAAVRKSLDDLLTEAGQRTIPDFAVAADRHRSALVAVFIDCMEQDPDVAEISAEKRLGLGGGSAVTVS